MNFKYGQGDIVTCNNVTEENHEKLELGKRYMVIGASQVESDIVYALTDEYGNNYYSIDRFECLYLTKEGRKYNPQLVDVIEEDLTSDVVNHPSHYANRGIEVITYIEDNMTEEQFQGYLEGNVLKYVSRYKAKNGVEDLKKASWYLSKLINHIDKGMDYNG